MCWVALEKTSCLVLLNWYGQGVQNAEKNNHKVNKDNEDTKDNKDNKDIKNNKDNTSDWRCLPEFVDPLNWKRVVGSLMIEPLWSYLPIPLSV